MSTTIYNRNRAVYLARRDAFFEKAKKTLLEYCSLQDKIKENKTMHTIVSLLRSSYEYAFMARKSNEADTEEDLLLVFLRSAIYFSFAIKLIIEANIELERFPKNSSSDATIQSNNIEKCSVDLIDNLLDFLKNFVLNGDRLFSLIKEKNYKSLSDVGVEKYKRSFTSVEDSLTNNPDIASSFSSESLIPFSN